MLTVVSLEPLLPLHGVSQIGFLSPTLSVASIEPFLLLRHLARPEPPSSIVGVARCGPSILAADFTDLGSSFSSQGCAWSDSVLLALDVASLDLSLLLRGVSRLGLALSAAGFSNLESLLSIHTRVCLGKLPLVLDCACMGPDLSVRSILRTGGSWNFGTASMFSTLPVRGFMAMGSPLFVFGMTRVSFPLSVLDFVLLELVLLLRSPA